MKKIAKNTFKNSLVEQLRNPKFAAAYLNEHFAFKGPKRVELLLEALRNVAEAQGLTSVAKKTGISRRTLYAAFSKTGNPTLQTLVGLLDHLGIEIQFGSKKAA